MSSDAASDVSSKVVLPERSERFGRLLGSVFRKWRRYVDDEFRDLGFTDATRGPLIALHDHAGEAMRQRDLADYLGLEASALVRVIGLLEERALVSNVPDPRDKRSKLLSLTPLGRQWARRIIAKSYELELSFVKTISKQDLAVTRRVLTRIAASIPDG
ncbi:MAG: MarR family transcriptional regulator [Hyphomicrobiales bacterium]|nr:MAG: MarR family transcriptional regulator [Hyphomicrobiales bacterium]